jgi:hypothetical protein
LSELINTERLFVSVLLTTLGRLRSGNSTLGQIRAAQATDWFAGGS